MRFKALVKSAIGLDCIISTVLVVGSGGIISKLLLVLVIIRDLSVTGACGQHGVTL